MESVAGKQAIPGEMQQSRDVAMGLDTRWKQRFYNFDRPCTLLHESLAEGPGALSTLEKEGVAQRFEYSFELAWKTMRDYLEEEGVSIIPVTARQVIK
ncbi:MAG TPA: nucleotidyltransferase substrate binding protein, partial [Candidatus Hydrogenedentes bacterium]|nr:nucleotidyltransferase substrate binding protein [Candidatus Hydrogenedentota bacterium]